MGSDRADHLTPSLLGHCAAVFGRPSRGLKTLSLILQKSAYCSPLSHIIGSHLGRHFCVEVAFTKVGCRPPHGVRTSARVLAMRQITASMILITLALQGADTAAALRGYSQRAAESEIGWEKKFGAIPQPDRLRENMRRLSARPHHVGSPYDKDNAEWILAQLKSWGLDAKIEVVRHALPNAERAFPGVAGAGQL